MLVNCVNASLNSGIVNFAKNSGTEQPVNTKIVRTLKGVSGESTAIKPAKKVLSNLLRRLAWLPVAITTILGSIFSCTDPGNVFNPTQTPPLSPTPVTSTNPTPAPTQGLKSIERRLYDMAKVLGLPIEVLMGKKSLPSGTALGYNYDSDYRLTYLPTSTSPDGKVMNIDYTSTNLVTGAVHSYPLSTLTELDNGNIEFDWKDLDYKKQYVTGLDKIRENWMDAPSGKVLGSFILKPDGLGNILVRDAADTQTLHTLNSISLEDIGRSAKKAFKTVVDKVQANLERTAFKAFMK